MPEESAPPARPDLYVVARFLDKLCVADASYTRSKLQAAVRLNYDLFRSYLAWLEQKGFVTQSTEKDAKQVVRVTPAGLEAYHQLVEWIKRTLGSAF